MSLLLVRVDDRLVHGQVMVGWRSFLGATQVLVASDRLACNPTACSLTRLTSPTDVGLVIDTVEGMTIRIRKGEFEREQGILLFESLEDTLRAMESGLCLEHLNVGGLRHHESCIAFTPAVSLSREDLLNVERIVARGVPVEIQMLPMEKAIPLDREFLERGLKA